MRKGVLSAVMFLRRASSTDFCRLVRSAERVFFCFSLNMSLPLDLADLSLKVASVTLETSAPATLTYVLVVMVYTWFTRLRGTPLTLKGPLTRRRPDASCLRKTTL